MQPNKNWYGLMSSMRIFGLFEMGGGGECLRSGNNEQQIYRWNKKNLRVEGGNLVIEAHNDKPNVVGTTRPYSSARIRTKHRGDWKYCRVDVRASSQAKGSGLPSGCFLQTKNTEDGHQAVRLTLWN